MFIGKIFSYNRIARLPPTMADCSHCPFSVSTHKSSWPLYKPNLSFFFLPLHGHRCKLREGQTVGWHEGMLFLFGLEPKWTLSILLCTVVEPTWLHRPDRIQLIVQRPECMVTWLLIVKGSISQDKSHARSCFSKGVQFSAEEGMLLFQGPGGLCRDSPTETCQSLHSYHGHLCYHRFFWFIGPK